MDTRERKMLAEVTNENFQQDEEKLFIPEDIKILKEKKTVQINWESIYDKTIAELGLQQTKRDQLITIYIALYAFLIPAILGTEKISLAVQGYLFLSTSILGILFAIIIIRYRIYKEVYWLCCQSITVLMGIEDHAINKSVIQSAFYGSLEKKGKTYITKTKKGKTKFKRWYYVRKNFVSSETLYYLIHTLITAGVFGLSMWMINDIQDPWRTLLGFGSGIVLAFILMFRYFYRCIKVYWVLVDHKDRSFNETYSKAWFLHFYL